MTGFAARTLLAVIGATRSRRSNLPLLETLPFAQPASRYASA